MVERDLFSGGSRGGTGGLLKMEKTQIYTIIALSVYALAMALIGCISYGKSKTLDGFLLGGRKVGA